MAGPEAERMTTAYAGTHLEEFMAFLPKLNDESDRGMVLIATSFVDELLRRTVEAFLIEGAGADALFNGPNAPLGTLATRIAAAQALGLISTPESEEANILRRIRNRFAHHIHVSFEDQSVAALCGNLTMAAGDYGKVVVGPRGRFLTSASSLILNLVNRPHYTALERRAYEPKPY